MSSASRPDPELFGHPAAVALMVEINRRGYSEASVEGFAALARIEAAEFRAVLGEKPEATVSVFEAYIADFETRVGGAFAGPPGWPDNLRAAAYEAVRWFREEPEATRFGMVGLLEGPELARVRREEVLRWCAGLIDSGREAAPDPDAVPAAAPMMAIGAIAEIFRRQQEGSLEADVVAAVAEMMSAAVRPYLGETAAQAELEIAPPEDLAE
jgi:hypothetical protein